MPYANSLYPDETPSNSASHPDPRCLTLRQRVYKNLSDIEALGKLKQTSDIADDNLFSGLRVNISPLVSDIVVSLDIVYFVIVQ